MSEKTVLKELYLNGWRHIYEGSCELIRNNSIIKYFTYEEGYVILKYWRYSSESTYDEPTTFKRFRLTNGINLRVNTWLQKLAQ